VGKSDEVIVTPNDQSRRKIVVGKPKTSQQRNSSAGENQASLSAEDQIAFRKIFPIEFIQFLFCPSCLFVINFG
jgi:hypothetical protein